MLTKKQAQRQRKKDKETKSHATIAKNDIYDYSCPPAREDTISFLLNYSARCKDSIGSYWRKMQRYYDGPHDIRLHSDLFCKDQDLPWEAAQCPDCFIHVESQIDPNCPDFEFAPRGSDDAEKAKQREKVVRYICDVNHLEYMNSRNERRLNIQGSAVWKVCWDESAKCGKLRGEVAVDNPMPQQIFPDPSSTTVDGCEYIGYLYRMHKQRAKRVFQDDFLERNETLDDYLDSGGTDLYESLTGESYDSAQYEAEDETVTITEWWYRQPEDGETTVTRRIGKERVTLSYRWNSGDIALCILINGREVRYIPKYWMHTDSTEFPFVIYNKVPNDGSIWGKSELEPILPLVDAADRELAFAQLNSAFSSNDIILAEENALADDGELDNSPGAVWKLRQGMMGRVQRLGNGAAYEASLYSNSAHWRQLMQETNGNFDLYRGGEPERVTTATGIALLNERAKSRQSLKKIDKSQGFERLYALIDRTALEYYDDGRVLLIGAAGKKKMVFRFSDYADTDGDNVYIPQVDIKIHIGDGLNHSKAFTISTINSLISTPVTRDNYKLVKAFLELIDLPQRAEICEDLDKRYGEQANSAGTNSASALDPSLLKMLSAVGQPNNMGGAL